MSLHVHRVLPTSVSPPRHFPMEARQVISIAIVALCILAFAFRNRIFGFDFEDISLDGDPVGPFVDLEKKSGSASDSPQPPIGTTETGGERPPEGELEGGWVEMSPPSSSSSRSSAAADEGLPVIEISEEELGRLGPNEQRLFQYARDIKKVLNAGKYWCVLQQCAQFHALYQGINCERFLTDQYMEIQGYQDLVLENLKQPYMKHMPFLDSSGTKPSKMLVKADGNCGYYSWRLIILFYLSSIRVENPAHYELILKNINLIFPEKGEQFLKDLMEGSVENGVQLLRNLVSLYITQNEKELEEQLNGAVLSDLQASVTLIMQRVLDHVISQHAEMLGDGVGEGSMIDITTDEGCRPAFLENIRVILGDYPNMTSTGLTAEGVLDFYNKVYKNLDEGELEKPVEPFIIETLGDEVAKKSQLRREYIERIKQDGRWAQELEMVKIAEIFGFKLCIIKKDDLTQAEVEIIEQLAEEGKERELYGHMAFGYHLENCSQLIMMHNCAGGTHFEYIVPKAHLPRR
ncbi:MAG: hypothetical protein K940chlam8_00082 [Chlamydiae bacterium]|nr:hypothetical protein [Chlamydiota bacterium]